MATQEWVFDPVHSVYYHAAKQMYAIPKQNGQWDYVPITDFRVGESSRGTSIRYSPPKRSPTKEEGEVEDDVGWGGLMEPEALKKAQTDAYADPSIYAYGTREPEPSIDTPKHILRLVVTESSSLNKGGMAMLDARAGGIHLGRDRFPGQARLRIKEMEVSKTHAVIYWGRGSEKVEEERQGEWHGEEGWWIVDLGSTHGTYLDTKRMSSPKESSLPCRLQHLSTITLGSTSMTVHIHPAWPCDSCQLKGDTEIRLEDGAPTLPEAKIMTPAYAIDSGDRRDVREMKRKREMAILKENLLNPPEPGRQYQDRAAMRRRLHPPSPTKCHVPLESETVLSPAPMSRFAAGIMAGQGWVDGQGLGKANEGRATPIEVERRTEKRGLGAADSKTGSKADDWRTEGKQRRYKEYS